ncbi:MAG: hypothetical protein CMJ46_06190 [Planctomyces sp.]|nr:hypothetical protein [Planctomyces sp.]
MNPTTDSLLRLESKVTMDLHLTGSTEKSSLSEHRLTACSSADLKEAIAKSSSDVLAFADVDRKPADDALNSAKAVLEQGSTAAVVLYPAQGLITDIWQHADPEVAILALPPTRTATIVINKQALESGLQETGDVADPLWAIIAGLAAKGKVKGLPQGADSPLAKMELPDLAPSTPGRNWNWLEESIRACTSRSELGRNAQRTQLRAALYQLNDYLDLSHEASQSMEGDPIADHWHAIMHRREPDYGNCKYWYRRVGQSPIFPDLNERAVALQQEMENSPSRADIGSGQYAGHNWDAFGFVDFCADSARDGNSAAAQLARQIQFVEMLLLLQMSL